MIEHTKTPWKRTGNYLESPNGTVLGCCYDVHFGQGEANAEFIVQCCNAHNKLVNALRRIANGEVSTITDAELATDTLRAVGESTEPYLYPTKGAKP